MRFGEGRPDHNGRMVSEQHDDLANLRKRLRYKDLASGIAARQHLHWAKLGEWELKEIQNPQLIAQLVEVRLLNHGKVHQVIQVGSTIEPQVFFIGLSCWFRTEISAIGYQAPFRNKRLPFSQ